MPNQTLPPSQAMNPKLLAFLAAYREKQLNQGIQNAQKESAKVSETQPQVEETKNPSKDSTDYIPANESLQSREDVPRRDFTIEYTLRSKNPISNEHSSNNDILTQSPNPTEIYDKYGNLITLNSKQQEFVNLVLQGKSCILLGAAGTGKTTTQRAVIQALFAAGKIPNMSNHGHKYLPENAPGVSISAYTRRATNNIRRNMSEDLQSNCVTIHKLLQYEPVYYEVEDPETGKIKKTMRFEATRHRLNPIPDQVQVIVIEEGSMVAVQLYNEIEFASPHKPQFIMLGDIQQLPPVFGSAILGFKMLEWPVIELTEVYRQALESPIIRLAHRILSGVPIPVAEFPEWNKPGELTLFPWKKKISADNALLTLAKFFIANYDKGTYNPETDAILIPFNKSCGTDELNKHIANKIARAQGRITWEVIHGFRKSYFSVGDKCLYAREDAIIANIYPNHEYSGAMPQSESINLDYWGNKKSGDLVSSNNDANEDVDFILSQVSAGSQDEDRVNASSHIIVLQLLDSDREVQLKSAGEINDLILGYALTVHKSQGSEWEKVFLCLHNSHATMLQRELLYTAVTRARKELFVICEPDSFEKGIINQRIKGNTLQEKAEFFKGKLEKGELQS